MSKYRGLTIDTKQWVYGCLIQSDNRAFIIPDDAKMYFPAIGTIAIEDYIQVSRKSVGQFTGVLDKNKKEIYGSIPINGKMSKGGDIVEDGTFEMIKRYIVIWNNHFAMWLVADGMGWQAELNKYKHCEVISTVAEKPELLSKEF